MDLNNYNKAFLEPFTYLEEVITCRKKYFISGVWACNCCSLTANSLTLRLACPRAFWIYYFVPQENLLNRNDKFIYIPYLISKILNYRKKINHEQIIFLIICEINRVGNHTNIYCQSKVFHECDNDFGNIFSDSINMHQF